jgi:hypothetical protein
MRRGFMEPISGARPIQSSGPSFNYLISHDRDGSVVHELCKTTGNIDSGKIGNIADAKNIQQSSDRFVTGKVDPNQPKYLSVA